MKRRYKVQRKEFPTLNRWQPTGAEHMTARDENIMCAVVTGCVGGPLNHKFRNTHRIIRLNSLIAYFQWAPSSFPGQFPSLFTSFRPVLPPLTSSLSCSLSTSDPGTPATAAPGNIIVGVTKSPSNTCTPTRVTRPGIKWIRFRPRIPSKLLERRGLTRPRIIQTLPSFFTTLTMDSHLMDPTVTLMSTDRMD